MGVSIAGLRFRAIQRILGAIVGLTSLIFVPPLLIAIVLDEVTVTPFVDSLSLALVAGFALWFPVRRVDYELRLRDGFFVVTMTWVVVGLVGAIPFMLATPHLSFADAVFESVSGITTTGATVITGLDALPRSVLFFRQSLNFIGGMGIVILAVAILPMLRVGGMQLFRAESTGPQKDSKLTPRIADTAKALWMVYLGLNTLCALAYWLGGMDLFDAVGHAMATLATGGFSTHDASFGHWNSPLLDVIGTGFMFLGGVNFGLHFYAWKRATTEHYTTDSELRSYVTVTALAGVAVTLALWAGQQFAGFIPSLRHAFFQTVSNMTTTGFSTTGFANWPSYAPLLLIMVSFVGGSAGSTAGGMKVARVMMVVRQGVREVKQLVHPKGQFLVKIGGKRVSESIVLSVSGFCTLYILSYLCVIVLYAATGVDAISAFSAAAATLNNLGPGLGSVASHFRDMNDAAIWVSSLAMILGRLEVFSVLVLFSPQFWRE